MSGTVKFCLFCIALTFAFIFYSGYRGWKDAEEAAQLSCLGSISTATAKALESGRLQLNGKTRELTKEEIADLIKQGKAGDCGRIEYIFEEVHIAIGEVNKKSGGKIRVWINGDDGISGTGDDLIFPWEENNK